MSRLLLRRSVECVETYVVLRRNGWRTADELHDAVRRSRLESDATAGDVRWIRSYVVAETDGSLGTICVMQATSPEAIRRHSYLVAWPVDEIVAVADTLVVSADASAVTA